MSKKLKKFLKSELAKIDARINVLEANLSRLVLAAIEAIAPQILEEEKPAKKKRKKDKEAAAEKETQDNNEQKTNHSEAAATTATAEKKTRRRRTAEEIAAEKATAEVKKQSEEKRPRQRRTAEEIAAEKAAAELSADDLRHLEGIGAVYADKLKAQGINNLQDMANISDERIDEIETVIKGFKKRIETNNWRGQASDLLKK